MTVEIPLTRGYVALVDVDDIDRVLAAGPWYPRPDRQAHLVYVTHHQGRGRAHRTTESLHNFITGWPLVDHRNGDGLDNRRANLRPCTTAQNAANRRVPRTSKSGLKGVRWDRGAWQVQIGLDGKIQYIGRFSDWEQAGRAYDAAAREAWGDFAALNFPRPGERSARWSA